MKTNVSINIDEINDALASVSSYTRLPVLLNLYVPLVGTGHRQDWFRLLGENWTTCDNIGEHLQDLIFMLPRDGPVVEMMDINERTRYDQLPDVVTIFRGAGKNNRWGACWSLSEDIARRFPSLNRYWQKTPMLYTATVRKEHILAVKLDREELEVITLGATIIGSKRIARAPI